MRSGRSINYTIAPVGGVKAPRNKHEFSAIANLSGAYKRMDLCGVPCISKLLVGYS